MIRMTRFSAVRFAAAVVAFAATLSAPVLLTRAAAAPSPLVGGVVMIAGREVKGTAPYGEQTFRPQDRTLSCIIAFYKPAPGTKLRTEWYALSTDNKKETRFNDQDMVMGEDNAKFSIFTRYKPWPVGKYRVKIFVDGKDDRSITFRIK